MHVFLGGFYGSVPVDSYGDLLGQLAGHGYIAITPRTVGVDTGAVTGLVLWVSEHGEEDTFALKKHFI